MEAIAIIHKDICFRDVIMLDYDRFVQIDLLSTLLTDTRVRTNLILVPRKNESNLYGYIIKGTNIPIIPYQFDDAEEFDAGYGVVKKGKYYGVINRLGERVLDCDYDEVIIRHIDESNLIYGFDVAQEGEWGFIDKDGKTVVPCQWNVCAPCGAYIACQKIQPGSDCLYSFDGKLAYSADRITPLNFGVSSPFIITSHGRYGILDCHLKEIVPIKFVNYEQEFLDYHVTYSFKEFFDDSERRFTPDLLGDYWKVIKKRVITLTVYSQISILPTAVLVSTLTKYFPSLGAYESYSKPFDEEDCDLNSPRTETIECIIEIITKEGNRVSLWPSDAIGLFVGGFAPVRQNNKWSFIDSRGNNICDFKYDKVCGFYKETAIVHNENGYGVIDKNGKEIIPCQYDWIYDGSTDYAEAFAYESDKYITVKDSNEDEGVYDRSGELIVPIKKGQRIAFEGNKINCIMVNKR